MIRSLQLFWLILERLHLKKFLFVFLLWYVIACILLWILDPGITTLADGFWFGFILVTTIGFGDFTVTTLPARIVAGILGLYGEILDPGITTLADGFWFGFILVTTIGFGDFTVTTLPARIVAGILGLYGDLVITFLTGAITSWFFEKFQAFRGHSVGAFVTQLEHMDELSDEELQQVADKAKALRAQKEAGKQTSA